MEIGDPVSVFVKAEHLALAEAGEPGLDAMVTASEYVGNGLVLHTQTSAGPLRLLAPAAHVVKAGDRVNIRFLPETCRAFPAETTGHSEEVPPLTSL